MNELTKYLIKELSPDQRTKRPKKVGLYAGGFKPPTNGHYKVVTQALADNPDLDEFKIYIGDAKRDGIDQSQSLMIWDIYKQYLPIKVTLEPTSKPPIRAVYDFAKENPEVEVDWVLGAREGNEEDFSDIAKRTTAADNYPNITLRTTVTDSGASGTAARNAAKVSQEKLEKLLPKKLSQADKDEVYNILNKNNINENKENCGCGQDPCITYGTLNEGKYDSLVTKLARYTLNAWKGDFEDNQKTGQFEIEVGPDKEFDYPHLTFNFLAMANFDNENYKTSGYAVSEPIKGLPRVKLNYFLVREELPRMWEQIAFDLRNTIRHEIEHLMQVGSNVKKGKEMASDRAKRKELMTGEKPWWAIWRDKYKDAEYYKLEKEVDANLQGLYLKAKKMRKPLAQVIDNYLKFNLNIPGKDQEGIKALWRERAPKINVPVFESKPIFNWEKKVTIPGPVPPAFLEDDVLTYEGDKKRKIDGKLKPQRDYPVEVIEVKWDEDKKEYVYTVMLLRDLGYGEKRGMKVPGKSEKEIKDKLADKQLTRAEFERQPTNRKDSFDEPIKLPKMKSPFGWYGESKILKEVLDPKTFNFKPLIKSITASMEKDGLKLKPYPKVIFKHNEEANAGNFFGNTAYYAPDSNEVVLYTLGRHPKDIMRSFAHELVHVHQNHEDRLHDITTDNINADEHLERLEREAYETGNIMFRSWTNSLTNESKDPFGLMAYAHELAQLNENEEDWYIYLDMDGVVADFDKRFIDLSGMLPQAYVDKNGLNAFWDLIDEKHKVAFWRGIELMPGAEKLVNFVSKYPYEMLTAPSIKKQSIIGKGLWIKDKTGTLYPSKPKVTYRPAKLKHTVKPNLTKYDILIDDKKSTIDRWNNAGGTAIFYVNADQVIDELKNLGL